MVPTKPTTIEIDMQKLEDVLRRVEANEFEREDYAILKRWWTSYGTFTDVAGRQEHQHRSAAEAALRREHGEDRGGAGRARRAATRSAETSESSLSPTAAAEAASSTTTAKRAEKHAAQRARPQRGRRLHRRREDRGAARVAPAGRSLPGVRKGTVYETGRPGVLVRLVGQAPMQAKVYELQKLRCNLCGVVFTAEPPEGVGTAKYDATAGSMIALLKYGSGMPFHREEKLQASLGIPLPASTQWDIVHAKAERRSSRPTRN